MPDDPRKFRRFETNLSVLLKPEQESSENIEAKLVDVSSNGISVLVEKPLPIGEKLEIEIQKSRHVFMPILIGSGEVVRMSDDKKITSVALHAGIHFTDPDKSAIQRLLQILQRIRLAESRKR